MIFCTDPKYFCVLDPYDARRTLSLCLSVSRVTLAHVMVQGQSQTSITLISNSNNQRTCHESRKRI